MNYLDDSQISNEEDDDGEESLTKDISTYTLEEKIVSAVWVHERVRNKMSWTHLMKCFKMRFGSCPPAKRTLKNWEQKLFGGGSVHDSIRSGRPCARLMHIPYVKASLAENPDMSLRDRAQELGLPRSTLLKILKYDLKMTFVPNPELINKYKTLNGSFPPQSGIWVFQKAQTIPDHDTSNVQEMDSHSVRIKQEYNGYEYKY